MSSSHDHEPSAVDSEQFTNERLRLLYALGDWQLALSAAAFLGEFDPDGKYSKIELRRFRCYETTAIVSYTRPFSASHGGVPRLTLTMTGVELSGKLLELHDQLLRMRNKVFAHSDAEMMRMLVQAEPLDIDGNFSVFLHPVFDEGLTFLGMALVDLNELLHRLFHAVYTKLLKEAQLRPADFNFRKDYLNRRT